VLLLAGADCRSQQAGLAVQATLADGTAPEVGVRAVGQAGAPAPGGPVQRSVFVECPKPGGPDTVSVLWFPPEGATAIGFPDVQPLNPLGPAPFQFDGVPVRDVNDALSAPSLSVTYAAPAPPLPLGGAVFVECFTAVTAAGNRYAASFEDAVTASAPAAPLSQWEGGPNATGAPFRSQAADPYHLWQLSSTLAPLGDVPLDQALCDDWAAFLQADTFFFAVRVPVVAPGVGDARSSPLPIVLPAGGAEAPRLELLASDPPATTLFELPLELRPERLGFAVNALPAVAGERWMTLGVAAVPAVSCPGGLAGAWELLGTLVLDLGGGDTSCSECVVEQYLCYEGGEPPFFLADGGGAVLHTASTSQGGGITCAGPLPARLAADPPQPPVTLERATLARASANTVVSFAHTLRGWFAPDEQTTVELATASSLGVGWHLYADSGLTQEIGGPVTISGAGQFDFWASTRLPFGVRGPESLEVTATTGDPVTHLAAADHLWIGSWAAPPPAPSLLVGADAIDRGGAVTAAGTLPDGGYRLVVVPDGVYLPGTCYTGEVLAAVDVGVSGNTLPETVVWSSATAGSYDVLALAGACPAAVGAAAAAAGLNVGDGVIVAGDDLSTGVGVVVTDPPKPVRRRLRRAP